MAVTNLFQSSITQFIQFWEKKKKGKKKIGRPNQKSFTFLLLELIIPRLVKKYSIVLGVEYESKSVCDKSTQTNFKLGALKNMLFLFCLG